MGQEAEVGASTVYSGLRYDRGMVGSPRVTLAIGSAVLLTVILSAQAPQTTDRRFPEGPGKVALFKLCNDCHGPEPVAAELRTRAEWSKTLDTMAGYGAEGTDEEFNQLLDYLVANFSPIPINKASAKELEAVMMVSAAVADAIASYRTAHGPFTSSDDLKNVPGLDAAKVDARKDRLIF
jgi:competence protein ComEA